MMPPKKSKAARAATENATDGPAPDQGEKRNGETEQPVEKHGKEEDEQSLPEVNIFKPEVVDGKRQRAAPAGKQMLEDWISRNLEAKEDVKLPHNEVYSIYLESCIGSNTYAVEQVEFMRAIKQKFPKGYAIQAESPYFSVVKERKIKVKTNDDKPKVKAESLKLKMKDILEDVFKEAGNPAKGVRFFKIKNMIIGKHPALQLDVRPLRLLKALQRGVEWGYVTLVAGMGQAGSYRWFVEGEEPEEKPKKTKKKKDETSTEEEGDKKTEEGDKEESAKPVENGTADSSEENKEGDEKVTKEGEEKGTEEPPTPRSAKKSAAKTKQAKKKGAKKDAKKKKVPTATLR